MVDYPMCDELDTRPFPDPQHPNRGLPDAAIKDEDTGIAIPTAPSAMPLPGRFIPASGNVAGACAGDDVSHAFAS